MNIGRNDPCPCGSGLKYKKCCLFRTNPNMDELFLIKQKMDSDSLKRRSVLESHGIYIDFPTPTRFKGYSVWALGSRIYPRERFDQTFHEFILSVLAQELGTDWITEQEKLPLEKRHFILQCHYHYIEWRKKNETTQNQVGDEKWRAIPDGWCKSLLSLAFDVACIIHVNGSIPPKILERLKLPDRNYQGARYELAVTAIFSRMNCKFEFLDEKLDHLKNTPGHCEFYATEPSTGFHFAIEAKSKVRKGVLHEGGISKDYQLWSNVTGPYRDALSQNPDTIPFFIFVDINSPPTPDIPILEKPWAKEILTSRKQNPLNKPDNPDPCTGIIFTNYSYHYQTSNEAKANGEALLVLPDYPKYIAPENFLKKLHTTISGYNYIPNIEYDGTISS